MEAFARARLRAGALALRAAMSKFASTATQLEPDATRVAAL